MMKRLVIFDLDGTLLNTIEDLAQATNHALECCGYATHDTEKYRYFVGNGINKLFERALPEDKRDYDNVMKIRSLFIPYYNIHNHDFTRPYDGMTSILSELQKKGIMIAVASNKYQSATEGLVKEYFPDIKFIKILGQREGVPTKPDPTIIYEIMKAAKATKEETLYIGDSNVDMQTANNAGVDGVGVEWGFRTREELLQNNPYAVIKKVEEILPLL